MRTIEFRGKRIENGEWVYGYVDATMYKDIVVIHTETGTHGVDPNTVGQFTGIRDKNGNKIFEGDIVREVVGYKRIGYVGWLQQECGFVTVWNKSDLRLGHRNRGGGYENDPSLEVIGNIHDNPELLSNNKKNRNNESK